MKKEILIILLNPVFYKPKERRIPDETGKKESFHRRERERERESCVKRSRGDDGSEGEFGITLQDWEGGGS